MCPFVSSINSPENALKFQSVVFCSFNFHLPNFAVINIKFTMTPGSRFETPKDELKFYFQRVAEYRVEIDNTYTEYQDYHKIATDMQTELHGYIDELKKSSSYYESLMAFYLAQNEELKNELKSLQVSSARVNSARRNKPTT